MIGLTAEISSWHVLIVDDKPDNLKLISVVLESRGAAVKGLIDSREVFDAVDRFSPNLILLDIAMPNLNGWEIYRQLRARPALANVPIIALTALSMQQDIQKGLDAGFDGYITKPYRSENVVHQMTDYVTRFLERQH